MMSRRGPQVVLSMVMFVTAAAGCRRQGADEADQIGASVGEAMASLDESVAGGATTAMLPYRRTPDVLRGPLWRRAMGTVIPSAYAASCWQTSFLGLQRLRRAHAATSVTAPSAPRPSRGASTSRSRGRPAWSRPRATP